MDHTWCLWLIVKKRRFGKPGIYQTRFNLCPKGIQESTGSPTRNRIRTRFPLPVQAEGRDWKQRLPVKFFAWWYGDMPTTVYQEKSKDECLETVELFFGPCGISCVFPKFGALYDEWSTGFSACGVWFSVPVGFSRGGQTGRGCGYGQGCNKKQNKVLAKNWARMLLSGGPRLRTPICDRRAVCNLEKETEQNKGGFGEKKGPRKGASSSAFRPIL